MPVVSYVQCDMCKRNFNTWFGRIQESGMTRDKILCEECFEHLWEYAEHYRRVAPL